MDGRNSCSLKIQILDLLYDPFLLKELVTFIKVHFKALMNTLAS